MKSDTKYWENNFFFKPYCRCTTKCPIIVSEICTILLLFQNEYNVTNLKGKAALANKVGITFDRMLSLPVW
jgi:hypothetical protein